jgi:hypothetical protein
VDVGSRAAAPRGVATPRQRLISLAGSLEVRSQVIESAMVWRVFSLYFHAHAAQAPPRDVWDLGGNADRGEHG